MEGRMRLTAALAIAVLVIVAAAAESPNAKKVLLTSVTALTFRDGQYTAARRTSPIPQASCTGGPCNLKPSSIQCTNVGDAGGGDVQWRCEAELPTGVTFGHISVSCEGYDNPDDAYVLKGSCGLEYTLKGSPKGGSSGSRYQQQSSQRRSEYVLDESAEGSGWSQWVFFALVCASFYFIFCHNGRGAAAAAPATGGAPAGGGFGGGGGGFGGSGGGGGGYYGGSGGGGTYTRGGGTQTMFEERQAPPQPRPQGPGLANFWTGLLGGAVLGNMMNRGGYANNAFRAGGGYNYGGTGAAFGGGGGGGGGGATHTATGYGGTTRR